MQSASGKSESPDLEIPLTLGMFGFENTFPLSGKVHISLELHVDHNKSGFGNLEPGVICAAAGAPTVASSS